MLEYIDCNNVVYIETSKKNVNKTPVISLKVAMVAIEALGRANAAKLKHGA